MRRDGEGWECVIHKEKDGTIRGCGGTDTSGKWRVEYWPAIPTLNKKGRTRHNQLTLETWDNQSAAEIRVDDLKNHFRKELVVPTQKTWLAEQQCRAGEHFFVFSKHSIEDLQFCERLLAELRDSKIRSREELLEFIVAHKECGIPCSPVGVITYCKNSNWCGDLIPRPTFIEAVQKARQHQISGFSGSQPISEEHIARSKSMDAYIMAYFQPNYPEATYPDEVFTDGAILRFCTYSFNTPREGMLLTEMQKWAAACSMAERMGQPLPPKPVEELVFKLVEDGVDAHGVTKWKKVPGELEHPRPWPRRLANEFLIRCRALKNLMARETLCGEPAKWTTPGGDSLKLFTGTKEELAAEAMARAKTRRVFATAEKLRILNASLEVDGGRGAPSVLWQMFGGGRRGDVERYCRENLSRENGRIIIERWQTKNRSCKDVTPMLNFYLMADFLIRLGLWTDENFESGFSAMTRIRILVRAGFWEESYEMLLSKEDCLPGKDFGYQPFELDDILNLHAVIETLRTHSTSLTALIWEGFSEADKQLLTNYRGSEEGQESVRKTITDRLNSVMNGPHFYTEALFNGVPLQKRTRSLLEKNPTGPNLAYLNRLLLEALFHGELQNRQCVPPNALRRSGMSAYYQVFESKDATITYFSTGGSSWEDAYKTFYSKKQAREHWQMLYSCMDMLYSDEDRKAFLPDGHKLDDYRTPQVIESEQKNDILAEEFKKNASPQVPRRSSGNKHRRKYSEEEKAKWVEAYKASGMTQKAFAKQSNLVYGVFHRWLEDHGATKQIRTDDEMAALVKEYQTSDLTQQEFALSKGIPHRTIWSYLRKAGLTDECIKHSPKQIVELLKKFDSSGQTQATFASENGIHETSLRIWLAKRRDGKLPGFAEDQRELSDIVPGRKFTDEQVKTLLTEFSQSGMTQEAFSAAKGIGLKTFSNWLSNAGLTERRRSKEEIARIVAGYEKSGMTKYDYAISCGIAPETLHRYLSGASGATNEQV